MSDDVNRSIPNRPHATPAYAQELERLLHDAIEARGVTDTRVINAMRQVPRHCFVPQAQTHFAYADHPLPIGYEQTISQPYIVALMTEAGLLGPFERCLEIGTGSGYQTAVLSLLCTTVFSIECVRELFDQSQRNLLAAGLLSSHIQQRLGNGYQGWPEFAPYDLIIVTAAPPEVPRRLLCQLAVGGRMVVPIGPELGVQQLQRWTRASSGDTAESFSVEALLDVQFVPMVGATNFE